MNRPRILAGTWHGRGWVALMALVLTGWAVHALSHPNPPAQAAVAPTPAVTAKATFAGGCFWCVESDFDKIPVSVHHLGLPVARPSTQYGRCRATSSHAEAVEVFDRQSELRAAGGVFLAHD
jgi:peptide-methionine (S)-S-oxide reductase